MKNPKERTQLFEEISRYIYFTKSCLFIAVMYRDKLCVMLKHKIKCVVLL